MLKKILSEFEKDKLPLTAVLQKRGFGASMNLKCKIQALCF